MFLAGLVIAAVLTFVVLDEVAARRRYARTGQLLHDRILELGRGRR